jgi:hypothetical protein
LAAPAAVGAFVMASATTATAQVAADECCTPLLAPVGARALALGNTLGARIAADGLLVNPATLAGIGADHFVIHTATTSLERSNTFSLIIDAGRAGVFALTYRQIDWGDVEATDPSGNPTGEIVLIDHVLAATYAARLTPVVGIGLSYKLYQFRQDCRGFCGTDGFAATTHMLDLGLHVRPPGLRGLELGGAIGHLGFPLQVINRPQASPSPARLRVGAAYELLHHFREDSVATVHVSLDMVTRWRAMGEPIFNAGVEAGLENTIFLRAGYAGGTGVLGGPSVGIGLRYDRFDLAIAKAFISPAVNDPDPFQVTFGIRF